MGIVNATPDSFSDGGAFAGSEERAVAHAHRLIEEGAHVVDVGGESTRPGAEPVSEAEELARTVGVVAQIRGAPVSIDTTKARVAREAVAAGASFVNDVSAFRHDPGMAAVVAESGVDCCLMHMLGEPRTMQIDPHYADVVSEVKAFLEERMAFAVAEGVDEERIVLDPGIGFGKTVEHNLELVRRLDELVALGRPVLVGVSRKAFIGSITGRSAGVERAVGTAAVNVLAYERGARIFRVHDVPPTRDALAVAAATLAHPWPQRATTTRPSTTTS